MNKVMAAVVLVMALLVTRVASAQTEVHAPRRDRVSGGVGLIVALVVPAVLIVVSQSIPDPVSRDVATGWFAAFACAQAGVGIGEIVGGVAERPRVSGGAAPLAGGGFGIAVSVAF